MAARISAAIVAFPRAAPIDAPALRLQRALAGLEAALANQRASVATWLATMEELRTQIARLARSMDRWRRFVPNLQQHMKRALEQVASHGKLSNDVLEVVSKALSN